MFPLSAGKITMLLTHHKFLSTRLSSMDRLAGGGVVSFRLLWTSSLNCGAVVWSRLLATALVLTIISSTGSQLRPYPSTLSSGLESWRLLMFNTAVEAAFLIDVMLGSSLASFFVCLSFV